MTPNGDAHLKFQVSQSVEPGSFRQRAEQLRWNMVVPAGTWVSSWLCRHAKRVGKHEPDDFAQQLLVGLQAAFDLGHKVCGGIQEDEGLLDGCNLVLGPGALVLEAPLGFEALSRRRRLALACLVVSRFIGDIASVFYWSSSEVRRKPCPI